MAHPWRICSRSAPSAAVRSPTLTSHYRSRRFVRIRVWGFRDAEVAGSNPAFPTEKVLVRALRKPSRPTSRSRRARSVRDLRARRACARRARHAHDSAQALRQSPRGPSPGVPRGYQWGSHDDDRAGERPHDPSTENVRVTRFAERLLVRRRAWAWTWRARYTRTPTQFLVDVTIGSGPLLTASRCGPLTWAHRWLHYPARDVSRGTKRTRWCSGHGNSQAGKETPVDPGRSVQGLCICRGRRV
jgi:hypothetical protein